MRPHIPEKEKEIRKKETDSSSGGSRLQGEWQGGLEGGAGKCV